MPSSSTLSQTHSDQILSDTESYFTQPDNLAVIQIQGADAGSFLQGQLPCDITQISLSQACFTGVCNAKGQVISTLILVGQPDGYLMILPASLRDKVVNKLKMYVLRSKVSFTDISETTHLITFRSGMDSITVKMPDTVFGTFEHDKHLFIRLPGASRFLVLSPTAQHPQLSSMIPLDSMNPKTPAYWHYDNIQTGLAWLNPGTSEKFIPQMLNLNQFGGISFDKGCYTGQEIVARAHYLGKVKRGLLFGECNKSVMLSHDTDIVSVDENQGVGKIIDFVSDPEKTGLLFVCSDPNNRQKNLILSNENQDKINLIEFKQG